MKWFDRFYLGTWQFGGQFKQLSANQIETLLRFALDSGVHCFDTAAVYGGGKVEGILGSCLPKDSIIVTKIPATSKPIPGAVAPIQDFYSTENIYRSVEKSLIRLRRNSLDAVLLHNWHPTWSSEAIPVLEALNDLKGEGITRRVGISLPNNFTTYINETVLSYIDVMEAPFNPREQWVRKLLPQFLRLKKDVLLRSLFGHGELIGEGYAVEALLRETLILDTCVVIGATSQGQITQNIECLKGGVR